MAISIDTIANGLGNTVLHPVALVGYVGYRLYVNQWTRPARDGLLTTAYVFLAIRATRWLSNRWRNGSLFPPKRLNAETWPGEVALITGAASGIGKETAIQLAKKGCKVAAIDVVDFKPAHSNIKAYKCNIAKYEEMEALRDQIRREFGKDVTIVANIAGINNKSLILDLDKNKVDAMIDINLKSHFYTAMLFLPAMIKRKRGHYLSIASTMGYAGICHQSDYVATKHGVVGMQESLYYEMQKMYRTPNVRTSIAIIGHTKTPLFQTFDVGAVGRFMAPLLEPAYVASLLVDAFEAQETRIICTPFSVQTAAGIKAYPQFMRDALQALSGADGSYPSRPSRAQLAPSSS